MPYQGSHFQLSIKLVQNLILQIRLKFCIGLIYSGIIAFLCNCFEGNTFSVLLNLNDLCLSCRIGGCGKYLQPKFTYIMHKFSSPFFYSNSSMCSAIILWRSEGFLIARICSRVTFPFPPVPRFGGFPFSLSLTASWTASLKSLANAWTACFVSSASVLTK